MPLIGEITATIYDQTLLILVRLIGEKMIEATLQDKRRIYEGREWFKDKNFAGFARDFSGASCLHCGVWKKSNFILTEQELHKLMLEHKETCKKADPA
jgi:hypothetical protein